MKHWRLESGVEGMTAKLERLPSLARTVGLLSSVDHQAMMLEASLAQYREYLDLLWEYSKL